MTNQPAFPDDEPILPAKDCACAICEALRRDAAVEAMLDVTRQHCAPPVGHGVSDRLEKIKESFTEGFETR